LPELCAHSSSARGSKVLGKAFEESMPETGKLQPIIQGEALVGINNVCIVFSLFYIFASLNISLFISDPSTGSYSWGS